VVCGLCLHIGLIYVRVRSVQLIDRVNLRVPSWLDFAFVCY
jgi:hypothetical protein